MAYNNGREDRKWRIWKEAEEKILREHGVDETTIEQIRIDDRADFNVGRQIEGDANSELFFRHLSY